MRYLDNDPMVEVLQRKLIDKGFLNSKYTTSYFGDKTLAALTALGKTLKDDFSVEIDPKVVDMQVQRFLME